MSIPPQQVEDETKQEPTHGFLPHHFAQAQNSSLDYILTSRSKLEEKKTRIK